MEAQELITSLKNRLKAIFQQKIIKQSAQFLETSNLHMKMSL